MPYLSDGEFKILYYIARQTIGFHKEKDRISFSQFQKATGVTRDTVGRTLINLKAKKLIVVNDNFEYRLDTDNFIIMLDKMEATGSLDDIDSLKIRPVKYGKKKEQSDYQTSASLIIGLALV
jgi:phage replication O-like protein O